MRVQKPPDRRHKGEQRAAWFLWLVKDGHQTLKAAAALVGLTDKNAWAIYHGLTHPTTEPQRPPEEVWNP